MPKLERLELCDNGIESGFDVIATQYPDLKVSGNKISDLKEVKHLSSLEHLESLDMVGNPVMGKSKDAEGGEGGAENSGNEEIKK